MITHHFITPRDTLTLPAGVSLIPQKQTHSDTVMYVSSDRAYISDGLVTNLPGYALTVKTGDSIPLILIDEVHSVIGIAHVGWQGIVRNITSKAIALMQTKGATGECIRAYIGPHICGACYQIYGDRMRRFAELFAPIVGEIMHTDSTGTCHLDLRRCLTDQLTKLGVQPTNITYDARCTKHDGLPSYQRDPSLPHQILSVVYMQNTLSDM